MNLLPLRIFAPVALIATASADEVVQMSNFEVVTTQNHGYVSTNAAEAFKTNESLMDIPQIDVVVTADLIHDVGYENTQDVLNYFGLYSPGAGGSGNSNSRGGGSATSLYIDEFPVHQAPMNPAVIDSVEIIKGGSEGMYMLNSGLGGILMEAEKKPLPYEQNIVTVRADQWGVWSAAVDSTGPIGKIGDVQIGYRLIAEKQQGHGYFVNDLDNRETLYPYFQANYRNTTIRVHFYGEDDNLNLPLFLITPTGTMYTGAGRRQTDQPNQSVNYFTYLWEASLLQKFSDNWEMRLSGQYFDYGIFGATTTVTNYNWAQQEEFLTNSENNQKFAYWTVLNDISGRYDLGPGTWEMKNTDILGWAFADQVVEKYNISSTAVPFSDSALGIPLQSGQATTTYAAPIFSAAAINAVPVPPLSSYYEPSTLAGSHTTTWNGGFYWQHTASVIPGWFDLIAGLSWVTVITDNVADVSQRPWSAQELHYDQYEHRFAGIVHLGREISIYALTTTNFSPSTTIGYLENGSFTPPQAGKDNEIGVKLALLGGKISGDFSWFQMVTSNISEPAGTFPNGLKYMVLTGLGVEEGVDGDLALTILPGWQLVGSFYAGHERDQNNNPVNKTWDNALGALTRYNFPRTGPLRGLGLGLGVVRDGARWISTSGITGAVLPASGEIKLQTGTEVNGFVDYAFSKRLSALVNVVNLTDQIYPFGPTTVEANDPSPPREFNARVEYKF